MLYITRVFNKSKMIYDVDAWFDNVAELKNDVATKYLLKSVDNAEYVNEKSFKSLLTGDIVDYRLLSSGCKAALLAVYETNEIVNFTEAGDNAFKALLNVASKVNKGIKIYTDNVVRVSSSIKVNVDGVLMSVTEFCNQSMDRRL